MIFQGLIIFPTHPFPSNSPLDFSNPHSLLHHRSRFPTDHLLLSRCRPYPTETRRDRDNRTKYKTIGDSLEDFSRVKPMLNHPHRSTQDLPTVEDSLCDTFTDAYTLCVEVHNHADDHYGELPPAPAGGPPSGSTRPCAGGTPSPHSRSKETVST